MTGSLERHITVDAGHAVLGRPSHKSRLYLVKYSPGKPDLEKTIMATRAEVDAKIDEYVSKFRKIGLAPFERSQRYSLFPAEESPEPKWPGTYPTARGQVYT